MRRRGALALLVAALGAGVLTAPSVPAAARGAPYEASAPVSYIVPTNHGDLYLEVVHPTRDGKVAKAPVVLTLSPYSALGRNRDFERWVPRGYARAWADVVGTGNSGGCWDYGGRREKETGYELVEWIAKQKWADGKIGMIGDSYNGSTATATATMRPPHLTTIVPEAAIARWYGYAYSGGIRYSLTSEMLGHQGLDAATDEGFSTPLLFDFGFAVPPPVDVQNEKWAERVSSTITPCQEIEHTTHGYNFDLPNYDKFWRERDYVREAHKIRIPVLVAHNWGDWNVKQEEAWDLFHALDNAKQRVLYVGSRWRGHERPTGEYDEFVDDWMDHYLRGANNGINHAAEVISQTADARGSRGWHSGRPKTSKVVLYAQQFGFVGRGEYQWRLFPTKPAPAGDTTPASFPSTNVNTESHANHHSTTNHDWFWFEGAPLRRNTRVFGEIKVQIYSKADRKWLTFVPSIVDYDHTCHTFVGNQHILKPECGTTPLVSATRGFLDSRYRHSLSQPKNVAPSKYFSVTVRAKPIDYVFRKGHSIGLQIQTEALEWMFPKPYPNGCEDPASSGQDCARVFIEWASAKTRVIVPVVGAPDNARRLFCLPGDRAHACMHGDH